MPYKPDNYNSVSPYFIMNGAQKFIDLMSHIFDSKELIRFSREDGKIMHAEIKIDDSVIMLSDSTDKYPAIQLVMHVYVPNVDEVFQRAIDTGCQVIEKPKVSEGDSDRRATFNDFAGNMWSVGTQISL